ncbi:MAG: GNAT family N-acetyltransferase [Acidobacteriia bacterium]|nr:GNAT family N-acetyltransferase [Terriglobia bacterium]
MSAQTEAPCELLPWDTDFFGCRIGRVRTDMLANELALKIDEWSRDNHIQCLYFLARPDDPATIRTAEAHGFGLVDVRLTLDRKVRPAQGATCRQLPPDAVIRPARLEDLPRLQGIARTAHGDARFFNDAHFPRPRVEEFYSVWITVECEGRAQKVFVAAGPAGQPLGYVSCHLESPQSKGQIGLVGVAHEARGKGLGSSLVLAALDWFAAQRAKGIAVVTQGRNVAAQRLYQSLGFLTADLRLWYHKWYG